MKVGYVRASTHDQGMGMAAQEIRLREAGCQVIFADEGQSGAKASRPGWDQCLAFLQEGDDLVSVRLDRWGRSVSHLLKLAEELNGRGVNLVCVDQAIDTRTAMGKMVFTILAAVAEFERSIGIERSRDGQMAAVAAGKVLGGPRLLSDDQAGTVARMRGAGVSVEDIGTALGISRASVYRYLQRTA